MYLFKIIYIPHGSDETSLLVAMKAVVSKFISHMVQMKLFCVFFYCVSLFNLYPTWFRWNYQFKNSVPLPSEIYIPHGSDETNWAEHSDWWFRDIYIPHGSDETSSSFLSFMVSSIFISHMVQMKPALESAILLKSFGIYIPHGSDETREEKLIEKAISRFISHMVQMKLFIKIQIIFS